MPNHAGISTPTKPDSPPGCRLGGVWNYALAVLILVLAFTIRSVLDPLLKDRLPFVSFFLATTFVAWYCGFGPSLLTLIAGWLTADWFFIDPRGQFDIPHETNLIASVSYFLSGLVTISFSHLMHRARERADQNAAAALVNQRLLEKEVIDRKRISSEVRRLNIELEQRVADRTAELMNLNHELESFTYSVSHDLRAPLRHIDGFAQILEQDFATNLPPEARRFLGKIRQGSQQMGLLVDDLLNLSRIGQQELRRQPVALNPLLLEVQAELASETNGRLIEWHFAPLPTIAGDPGLIRLVFMNLLANAIKYTRPQERASITVDQVVRDDGTVIRVRDNGVGFDMRYAGKLFGVFQRLHPASEFEGTGIGLATVARIIRKHGGRIWAEAEVGQGATFYLTLEPPPRRPPPSSGDSSVILPLPPGLAKPAKATR